LHKVQYGQSLWSIAIMYGTTIEQIQRWNNLGESIIVYEQQVLLVQKGATQPVVIPTQAATTDFSSSPSPTPSPTVTQTVTTTKAAALPTGQGGSMMVFLIIGVSIVVAGVGASLRVKLVQ
jgi:LysM repeat protein